jgi:hypothetical protein
MNHSAEYAARSLLTVLMIYLCAIQPVSCSKKSDERGEDLVIDEEIYGIRLGEGKQRIFERTRYRMTWERIPESPRYNRGEMYNLSGTPGVSRDIDHLRLAFIDEQLMELIIYFKDTSVTRLRALKRQMEDRYNSRAVSPPGSIEMAYKTYWLKGPGFSVTIRRITKKPKTELYVQYIHNELHRRFLNRKQEEEKRSAR